MTDSVPASATHRSSLWERLTIRLSHTEQLLLTKYLSVLLRSGLPIDDALDLLMQQAKGSLKKVLTNLKIIVTSGKTLADGLELYPQIFSSVYVNLIRAGEASGQLQQNFEQLSVQMQKEHELRQKIQGAMMYPAIVLISALGVSVGIIVFVLPNITKLFASLNVELPVTTKALLWISVVVNEHGILIALGGVCLVIGWLFARTLAPVKPITHWITLHFPVIGTIARNTNLARISRLLGTLLITGMPITAALPVTISVLNNVYYRKLFTRVQDVLAKGGTIAMALQPSPRLVPPLAVRLIRVGEETGTLGDMLLYLASFYEQEVDESTKNAATLLEPLMIVMIGIMVGTLAFSIITPIYKVIGSI
jgi:type II secretory pathway component PulF